MTKTPKFCPHCGAENYVYAPIDTCSSCKKPLNSPLPPPQKSSFGTIGPVIAIGIAVAVVWSFVDHVNRPGQKDERPDVKVGKESSWLDILPKTLEERLIIEINQRAKASTNGAAILEAVRIEWVVREGPEWRGVVYFKLGMSSTLTYYRSTGVWAIR